MTIKIPSSKQETQAPTVTKFTLQDIEQLFSNKANWYLFYKRNETRFWKENLDIYEWPVFPLLIKEGKFHKCILHPTVEVDGGNKQYTFIWKNIHFSEFVSHCIFYKPEEHKQYIIEKLLKP